MKKPATEPKEIPAPVGMTFCEEVKLGDDASAGISRPLFRATPGRGKPVLLVHGGSASSETFGVPNGGLVRYLVDKGFDVYALDWSASQHVTRANHVLPGFQYEKVDLDFAAECELPAAIDVILALRKKENAPVDRIGLVAHCFGAGMVAMSVARGKLAEKVDAVVLLTLGLYYEVPWDGVLKADDHLLERVRVVDPGTTYVSSHPDEPWPKVIEDAHRAWPVTLRPIAAPPTFERLSFMFGLPYLRANVDASFFDSGRLAALFGPMPLRLYQHGVQNVRRGFAAPFDAPEKAVGPASTPDPKLHHHLDLEPWTKLRQVTLITGRENALWHRDGLRHTYEHLRRALPHVRISKHLVSGYAHQDLLWGRHAADDVFGTIAQGV